MSRIEATPSLAAGVPIRLRTMVRLSSCAPLFSWLVCLGLTGCGDSPQPAPASKADSCAAPAAPAMSGAVGHVVGDGTAASCTTDALRAALASGGSVSFDCGADPVTLAITETLVARDGTSIDGGGRVTLDGGDAVRILRTESQATVLLAGLTFQHGHARHTEDPDGGQDSGGAVLRGWQGKLHVRDCTFQDNVAEATDGFGGGALGTASSGWTTLVKSTFRRNSALFGGAVYSMLSDLTVVDSDFEDNQATGSDGGAIFTDGAYTPADADPGDVGGTISVCGSRFVGNTGKASSGAGFLFAYGRDQLLINRSEFRGNRVESADPGLGGALRIDAVAFVDNSLFVDNSSAGQGGAVWMGRGPAVFENVTFHGNHADLWGGAISYGDQAVTLDSCTVARNVAGEGSDALFGNEGALVAHDSLFVNNGEKDGPNRHCRVALEGDHNLVFPASADDACGAGPSHADPRVADALADLGGATETLAIGPGGGADGAGVACPATDQRGVARDVNRCDLGAFELP
jgi:predicted outer membrane repeat protein